MREFVPTHETAEAETRLEWMLGKLHEESLRRGSTMTMPVLIGGSALRRAYGLTRASTNLDFAVETEQEMKQLLRTATKLARERWPAAKLALREGEEEDWTIDDGEGRAMLHLGGLAMARESLALAVWKRETWTLPIGRLAAMKIHAAMNLRSKVRDLYDMGFIAQHYPGDITTDQAQKIACAGHEAAVADNRWTADHARDEILSRTTLASLAEEVVAAANEALTHIDGARRGN